MENLKNIKISYNEHKVLQLANRLAKNFNYTLPRKFFANYKDLGKLANIFYFSNSNDRKCQILDYVFNTLLKEAYNNTLYYYENFEDFALAKGYIDNGITIVNILKESGEYDKYLKILL